MFDQFNRQFAQMMQMAGTNAAMPSMPAMPGNLQDAAAEGVNRTREACDKMNETATIATKTFDEITKATQKGAKQVSDKMAKHATANTEAAFEAAEEILRTENMADAMRMQAEFTRDAMTNAAAQMQELFELSGKVAQKTAEQAQAATQKAFAKAM